MHLHLTICIFHSTCNLSTHTSTFLFLFFFFWGGGGECHHFIYFNILVHKTITIIHIYIQYKNVYRQCIITCTLYALKTLYDIIQRRVLERRTYDLLSNRTCQQVYIHNKTISIDYTPTFHSIFAYNIIFIYTKSNMLVQLKKYRHLWTSSLVLPAIGHLQ